MGVSALTAGAIKCILYQFPDAEICLLDYGKERLRYQINIGNRKVFIPLINIRFSKKIYLRNNIVVLMLLAIITKLIPIGTIKRKIIHNNFYLKHVFESDIVASISGGDSFSDIYGIGRFLYYSLPQLLILILGKRLTLLPQTIGPFNSKMVRFIARYILCRSKRIYSRDYTGIKEIQRFIQNNCDFEKLKFCYDVGFVLDPIKPNAVDLTGFSNKKNGVSFVVGLNISGLLYKGGYTQNNMFGLKIEYKSLINDFIEFFIEKKKAFVMLIPHVFGGGADSESDSVICEKVYSELKEKYSDKLALARGRYDQNEIKYIIGLCDFFIGSRMHACIAALSQNIPTVAIAYSKKFLGVMESIGFDSIVADPRKIGKKEVMKVVIEALEQRDKTIKELEQKMPFIKKTVLNLFSDPMMFS
jgi:polysaccharide pyruvyl transferase WcaK-like protein